MKPDSLSGMASGAKSVLSGVLSCYLGLVLGSTLLLIYTGWNYDNWAWPFIAWFFLFLTLLGSLKTTPFLLLIGWTLIGLVWGEWNRLNGCCLTAMLLITGTCIRAKINPFTAETPTLFWILAALILLPLLFAAALAILRRCKHH